MNINKQHRVARLRICPVRNEAGQSIVQVLISIGLMGIMMMAFASMITTQQTETRALSEKLAAMDLEKLLIASLANGSVCKYVTNNPTRLTFDSTKLPQTITLPDPDINGKRAALYTSLPGGVPGPIAAQIGSPVSTVSNTLTVKSIQLQITPPGAQGRYYGNWLVNFDSAGAVRQLKPVSVATSLIVDDTTNPTQATILDCQGIGGGVGKYQEIVIHYPGEPMGGGFITVPQATYPTVAGASSPEVVSAPFTFTPQGNRVVLNVRVGGSLKYTGLRQYLALRTYLHVQQGGGPDTVTQIDNSWSYPITNYSLASSSGGIVPVNVPTTPGVSVTLRLGLRVYCNSSMPDCNDAANALFKVWAPVEVKIQEYY